VNRPICQLGNRRSGIPAFSELLEKNLPHEPELKDYDFQYGYPAIARQRQGHANSAAGDSCSNSAAAARRT
jgi:hypothetical protein